MCERVCEFCGGQFIATASQVKRGDGRFCSRSCANRSKTGSDAPNWKGGREKRPSVLQQRVYNIVHQALKAGELMKEPCVACDSEKSEMHHEDYSKPLEVWWLCRKHHMRREVYLKRGRKTEQ